MAHFKKGAPSPNPRGRPPGAKTSLRLAESGLVSEADLKAILAKVIDKAKDGDLAAAAMILDRTVAKVRPVVDDVAREMGLAEALEAARLRAHRGCDGEESGVPTAQHATPDRSRKIAAIEKPSVELPVVRTDPFEELPTTPAIRIPVEIDIDRYATPYQPNYK